MGSNHEWRLFLGVSFNFLQVNIGLENLACHWNGGKPLSQRVLKNPLSLKMPCTWRRPFCPGQKCNQNITTNISQNILDYSDNLFQTPNLKQYWQKWSGKGHNIILIRSEKGRNMILIRAQLIRKKILLIADRAQIDRLLVLWAWQERVGRDKSVSRAQ